MNTNFHINNAFQLYNDQFVHHWTIIWLKYKLWQKVIHFEHFFRGNIWHVTINKWNWFVLFFVWRNTDNLAHEFLKTIVNVNTTRCCLLKCFKLKVTGNAVEMKLTFPLKNYDCSNNNNNKVSHNVFIKKTYMPQYLFAFLHQTASLVLFIP